MAIYAVPVSEAVTSEKIYFVEAFSDQDARKRAESGMADRVEEISDQKLRDRVFGPDLPELVQSQGFNNPLGNLQCPDFRRSLGKAARQSLSRIRSEPAGHPDDLVNVPDPIALGDIAYRHDRIRVEPGRFRVFLDDDPVDLPLGPFRLLIMLIREPGKVFSRGEIVEAFHGEDGTCDERICDSMIKRIRRAFRRVDPAYDPIQTLYTFGYKIKGSDGRHALRLILEKSRDPERRHEVLCRGKFAHDRSTRESFWNEAPVDLTYTETMIMTRLVEAAGIIINQKALRRDVSERRGAISDYLVNSHIRRLRAKLRGVDPEFAAIQTVYGEGYRFRIDA